MTKPICRVCKSKVSKIFSSNVLQKYPVEYFQCSRCDYIQTENPYWLEEAYNSPINVSDTGMIMRNLWFRNVAATTIFFLFDCKGKFLDYGGGYGVFVRMMRDVGFDFYWQDKYTENLFAQGFEFTKTEKLPIDLLTCFEAFEHFVDPLAEFENLLCISRNILLSSEFVPEPLPSPSEWWYYGVEHGQHIGFYQKKTFLYLAEKYNLNFYTNSQNIHLLTEKQFLAPTFKWITKVSKYITPFIQKRMQSLTWNDSKILKTTVS